MNAWLFGWVSHDQPPLTSWSGDDHSLCGMGMPLAATGMPLAATGKGGAVNTGGESPARRRRVLRTEEATRSGRRASLVVGGVVAALMVAAVASADNLNTQDLVTDGNAAAVRLGNGNAEVWVQQTGGSCDANGDRINVTSSQSWLTIASPGFVNVPDCGNANAQSIEYALTAAAPLGGVAKVTGSENVDDPQINTGPGSDFDVTVVPRAPAALGSPSKTTTSIDLDWTLSPDDSELTNYQLERATSSGGPWTLLANPAKGSSAFTNTGLWPARSTAIASRPASRPAVESERWSAASRVRSALRPTRRIRHRVFRLPESRTARRTRQDPFPQPACSVVDGQDGNSSFPATLSALTGPLAAYDLGSQTATCSYTDAGGLSATASATYTIVDTTNPGISFVSRTPAANVNGWNKTNVTVEWSCTDSGSGVVSSSVTETVSTEGSGQSATGTCTDHAGNTASDTRIGINIDLTKPTISAAATTSPNGAGWYNGNVTVHFTCTDGLSGIPAGACPADQTLSDEGAAVSSTAQTVTDTAGNASDASNVVTVKIDKTDPTITGSATTGGDPYTAGTWTNEDVVVSFQCTDSLSDVASSNVAGQTVSFEGKTASVSNAGTCTDNAGNTAATGSFGPIWIDKTAPNPPTASVSPPQNAAGWSNSVPVTVSFAANGDGGSATDKSGVAGCTTDASFTAESATVAGDVASGTCTDNAGNESTATEKTVKVDLTKPTISAAATTSPNGAGWYNGNVTVHFTCTDGLSGIPAGACPADQTLSDEGAAVSSTAQTVTDTAGNASDASNVVTVKIDKTDPTITGSATTGGDPYTAGTWTNEDVVVSFQCTDSLSDVASSNVAGQTVSFEGKTASVSNAGTCTDNAGNTAATGSFGPIWIDKTAPNPPTASVSPPQNAAGWSNSVPVTVSFAANGDGGSATDKSGVAGCTTDASFTAESATVAGDVASGTCTDNAGNESTATERRSRSTSPSPRRRGTVAQRRVERTTSASFRPLQHAPRSTPSPGRKAVKSLATATWLVRTR